MKRPLVYAAGGFVLGEVWLLLPVEWKAVIPVLAAAGIFCLWKRRQEHGNVAAGGRSLVCWILPLFCFAFLGAGRFAADQRTEKRCEAQTAALEGRTLQVEGTLDDVEAGKKERYAAVLTLSDVVLYTQDGAQEFEGAVLVYLDEMPAGFDLGGMETTVRDRRIADEAGTVDRLRVSMRVSVWGKLESMGHATNPGQFDFGEYYHALGIEGRMFGENLQAAGEEYSPYLDGLFRLKCRAREMFARLCVADSDDMGIFAAVVLGDKTALASDVRELYQRNGIAHLLAVSGLHISLIGMGCYRLLRRRLGLEFALAGVLAAAVTVTYGILTGGSASVVRAVVMVCLQILADKLGRTYDLLSAMALAALLLLADSPALLFQAGFQLSFGAILAIGAVYPALETWTGVSGRSGFGQTVLLGIVIQVVTLPVTAYHFYEYPIYGTVLNLLVIPLMGYVLVSGLAGLALGAIWLPSGRFAIGTGHYILEFYEWLCRVFEELPGAVQIVGRPRTWQMVLYAAMWCLATAWAAGYAEKDRRGSMGQETDAESNDGADKSAEVPGRFRSVILALCACAGYLILQAPPVSGLRITFLDVGQGDGICLESRDIVILADGGSTSVKDLGDQVLEPYLKSRGISRIDYAVVSHGDEDHISGLRYLLEEDCGITVGTLVLPQLAKGDQKYGDLERLAGAAGTVVVWMKAGDRIYGPDNNLKVTCLYAGDQGYREDTNDHSMLLEVSYGKAGILLTGDIGAEGEKRWLEELRAGVRASGGALGLTGRVQLLKVAHHGSSYSSSREFLEYVDPDWAVISCGMNNQYGHPGEDTRKRLDACGARTFLTMDSGAVMMTTDGERMKVQVFSDGK